jgi:TRAP-type C4-dicarboxylate transport system permease small subunit
MRQTTPAFGLPMGYAYSAIPVGAAIMVLQSLLFALLPGIRDEADRVDTMAPGEE